MINSFRNNLKKLKKYQKLDKKFLKITNGHLFCTICSISLNHEKIYHNSTS